MVGYTAVQLGAKQWEAAHRKAMIWLLGVMQQVKVELAVVDTEAAVVLEEVRQQHVPVVVCGDQRVHPDTWGEGGGLC